MIGDLYKIVCTLNNKVYIGKTYRGYIYIYINRFKEHIKNAFDTEYEGLLYKYDYKIYRAIRKYGPEHFKIELIGQFEEGILEQKEQEYILKYDSYNNGYNSTLGGDGNKIVKFSDEEVSYIINTYKGCISARKIADEFRLSRSTIIKLLKLHNIDVRTQEKVAVVAYIFNGKIESKHFESIMEASRYCNMDFGYDFVNFYNAVNRSINTFSKAYGYYWALEGDLDAKNKIVEKLNKKNIVKVRKTTEQNKLCKICNKPITVKAVTGMCNSCANVTAKGKSPKPSKEEVQTLINQGLQIKQIAELYGRTDSTVHYWIKQYGIQSNSYMRKKNILCRII